MALLLSFRLLWDQGIDDLGAVQFQLSLMAVPTFLFGLYSYNQKTDVHPWSLAIGAVVASIYIFGFYFGYTKADGGRSVNGGITGFGIHLVITLLCEVVRRATSGNATSTRKGPDVNDYVPTEEILFPNRPTWDLPKLKRFGEHTLTPQLVWKSMEGTNEPLANPWYVMCEISGRRHANIAPFDTIYLHVLFLLGYLFHTRS